jgi:hypothetical protein
MHNLSLKINPLLKALRSFGLKKESRILIENQNIYKKAISQKRINDLKKWLGGDYSKLSFDGIFDGKLRISIPFNPPQRRMLTGLFEKLIDSGWRLPDMNGEAFKINKVEQKITLPGGKEKTIIKEVADLKLSKFEQIVIPSGPRAGQMTTRKTESSISKIISNPANNIPKEYSDWWNTIQQRYSSDNNWKEIESLFNDQDEIDSSNYVIIISRDPIDVLRMSDHKNIDSCHSEGGSYFHCAIQESRGNGPIAYIVNKDDLEKFLKKKKVLNKESSLDLDNMDISLLDKEEIFTDVERDMSGIRPEGRLRFRRYNDIETEIDFAVPELKVYGKHVPGFTDVVRKWAWEKQKGIFEDDDVEGGIYLPEKYNITSFGGSYRNNLDSELLNIFFEESGKEKIKENPYSGNVEHNGDDTSDEEQEAEELNERFNERCRELNNRYQDDFGATFQASASYDGIIFFGASAEIKYEIFLAEINSMKDAEYITNEILDEIQEEAYNIFDINDYEIYILINKIDAEIKKSKEEFFLSFNCEFTLSDPEDSDSVFSFFDEMVYNVVRKKDIVFENMISKLESKEIIKSNNFEETKEKILSLNLNHFDVSSEDVSGLIKVSLSEEYNKMYIPINDVIFFGMDSNRIINFNSRFNKIFGSNKITNNYKIIEINSIENSNEIGIYKFLNDIRAEIKKQVVFDFYKQEEIDYSEFSNAKNIINNTKIKFIYDIVNNPGSVSGYQVWIENFSLEILINKINSSKEIKFLADFIRDVDRNYEQIYMIIKNYIENKLMKSHDYYRVMMNQYLNDGLNNVTALLTNNNKAVRRFALWCKANWERFNFFQKDYLMKNQIRFAINEEGWFISSLNNFGNINDALSLPFGFSGNNLIIEQNKIDYSSVD